VAAVEADTHTGCSLYQLEQITRLRLELEGMLVYQVEAHHLEHLFLQLEALARQQLCHMQGVLVRVVIFKHLVAHLAHISTAAAAVQVHNLVMEATAILPH
jgi:DNA-binding GntR family transcriptional regulator